MKTSPSIKKNPARKAFHASMAGMTLLELTVVILVLLSLISILFIGANAWKKGSDQTLCIMNIRNVQNGLRSFSNLYGHSPGQSVAGLKSRVVGLGKFVESTPSCPSTGAYTYGLTYGADTIPPIGELYLQCSLSATGHIPANFGEW